MPWRPTSSSGWLKHRLVDWRSHIEDAYASAVAFQAFPQCLTWRGLGPRRVSLFSSMAAAKATFRFPRRQQHTLGGRLSSGALRQDSSLVGRGSGRHIVSIADRHNIRSRLRLTRSWLNKERPALKTAETLPLAPYANRRTSAAERAVDGQDEHRDWPRWVGTRQSPLRVRRRKAAVEVLDPGSSHSSASAGDPERPFGVGATLRLFPNYDSHPTVVPWLITDLVSCGCRDAPGVSRKQKR